MDYEIKCEIKINIQEKDLNINSLIKAAGYRILISDRDRVKASEKINEAIAIWEEALTEAKPDESSIRRARINRDVTVATYLNIIGAAVYAHEFEKARQYLRGFKDLNSRRGERKQAEYLRRISGMQWDRFKSRQLLKEEL